MKSTEKSYLLRLKGNVNDLNADELLKEAEGVLKEKYCNYNVSGDLTACGNALYRSFTHCAVSGGDVKDAVYSVYAGCGGTSGKIVLSFGKKQIASEQDACNGIYDEVIEDVSDEEFALITLSGIADVFNESLEVKRGGAVYFAGEEMKACSGYNNVAAALRHLATKYASFKAVYAEYLISCAESFSGKDIEKEVDIYEKAVTVYGELLENLKEKDDEKYALSAARAYVKYAKVNVRYDDHEVATAALENATAIYGQYAQGEDDCAEEIAEAAELLVAESLKTRRADYVRKVYDKAVAGREELYKKHGSRHALPLAELYETGVGVLHKERRITDDEITTLMNKIIRLEEDIAECGTREAWSVLSRAFGRSGNALYGKAKYFAQAADYFVKAVKYIEISPVSRFIYIIRQEYSRFAARAGISLYDCGRKDEAAEYLMKAVTLFAEMSASNELFDYKDYLKAISYLCGEGINGADREKYRRKTKELCLKTVEKTKVLYERDELYYTHAYGKALYVLGELHSVLKEYEISVELFEYSLDVIGKGYAVNAGAFEFDFAEVATKAGEAHYYSKNYEKAEKRLLEALEATQSFSEDYYEDGAALKADIINAVANVYCEVGDFAGAEDRFLESAEIRERLISEYGAKHVPGLAESKYRLAEVYEKTGNYEDAIRCLSEVVALLEKENGDFYADKLVVYYSALSAVERKTGHNERADTHLKKAAAYAEKRI